MNANELYDRLKLVRCFAGDGQVLNEAEAMLRQQQAEIEALKAFVKPIIAHGDDCVGNWDGDELQDLAVKTGLLIEIEKKAIL